MATGGSDIQSRSPTPVSHTVDAGDFQQIVAELNPEDRESFEALLRETSRLRIMVTGETGVGKSTIFNALVGTKVFEVYREIKQRVTTEITEKICKVDGIEIVAIDCPGLHDACDCTGPEHEMQYIQDMKDAIDRH